MKSIHLYILVALIAVLYVVSILALVSSTLQVLAHTDYPVWADFLLLITMGSITVSVFLMGCYGIGSSISRIQHQGRRTASRKRRWAEYHPQRSQERWEQLLP